MSTEARMARPPITHPAMTPLGIPVLCSSAGLGDGGVGEAPAVSLDCSDEVVLGIPR